ncbi:histidine ammonia-lyase [Pseudoalteromonas translucida KMM 520]|uniref:tyrosine ammonia-lyase n=1 Tax=Pseudoalteromonas translucida KMM 520 TaxID=1315283 RepID=A0A0U2NL76_9GAMM|nr:aromatic amino acid ammonia-lyase [Pseudoalteromonas translucida]ALS35043.1 histidine ammonia-lyase [Pseudoalteromonas translucida KMM 520]
MPVQNTQLFGQQRLSIENIVDIAHNYTQVQISDCSKFSSKINSALSFLDTLLKEDGVIYGVTTGYGDSVTVAVPLNLVDELPLHLTRFHGCGLGDVFNKVQGRAILATRLTSLSQGYSGISWEMLNLLRDYLNHDIVPVIPQEGSVGASGDLTPLSYVAGAMVGERDVYYKDTVRNSLAVMQEVGLTPLVLRPKEGLAVMNGTAVMTALACLAFDRANYLAKLASRITAIASLALKGNSHHFDEILFSVKPHPGQQQIARWIRDDLNHHDHPRNADRLQDRYSIRCAPHVIGVLQDSLPFFRQMIENELNSANDNPIIDGEGEHVLHGGHFYGGHIAMAMDSMKTAVANLADLADRQIASLVDTKYNNGLASNLSDSAPERRYINHGFKAVQIGASAYTAEALKLTMPASVFSRSTECHNQDKVSMGTIASRDCLRILQLTEQVMASTLLAAIQGLRLRIKQGELEFTSLTDDMQHMYSDITGYFENLTEDRPMEAVLRQTISYIQSKRWTLYE